MKGKLDLQIDALKVARIVVEHYEYKDLDDKEAERKLALKLLDLFPALTFGMAYACAQIASVDEAEKRDHKRRKEQKNA